MSLLAKSVSYCRQIASRLANKVTNPSQQILGSSTCQKVDTIIPQATTLVAVRWNSNKPPHKFETPSPYKKPGPFRHGYQQKFFDGGRLPRGLSEPVKALKPYRPRDSWDKKHALFGQNDYIDILGDSNVRPVDLINAPTWLKGFNGNEMQRLVRRLKVDGYKLRQLYPSRHHEMVKRVRYLYKKYNWRRGTALPGPDKWQP